MWKRGSNSAFVSALTGQLVTLNPAEMEGDGVRQTSFILVKLNGGLLPILGCIEMLSSGLTVQQ